MPSAGQPERPSVRRPTLRSVAHAAGCSPSTASLVFSGNGPVAEATRARVLAAAEQLGYAGPDPLAASLRRGRADVVGVVVEGKVQFAFRDPYALTVADGLAAELDELPAGMLLLSQDPADPSGLLERLRSTALDAVVFFGCGRRDNVLVPHLRARGVPMVAMGAPYAESVVNVDVDNRAAMHGVAAHLRSLGHERLAVLALPLLAGDDRRPEGPARPLGQVLIEVDSAAVGGYQDVVERIRGLLDVLPPEVPTVVARGTDVAFGAAAIASLLDLPTHERPTAVIALSDLLAMGVVRAASDRGLCVPDDVSVTGFDGVPLPWWQGALTTVVQPGVDKGALAGRLVRAALDGEPTKSVVLPTTFRVGTSSSRPRGE